MTYSRCVLYSVACLHIRDAKTEVDTEGYTRKKEELEASTCRHCHT